MKKQKVKFINCFILDKSGSMGIIRDKAISGFNEYLQSLKSNKHDQNLSLVLFDTESIETLYKNVPVKEVKPLNERTYKPLGGTPLYDACVNTIESLEAEVSKMKGKVAVSVVIMTDGEENSSSEHDQKCLRDLVEHLQARGNYTFAYMGANQDAWANAAKMGISYGNTMAWASTAKGTQDAFRGLGQASALYMASAQKNSDLNVSMSIDNFFSGGDKDDSQPS